MKTALLIVTATSMIAAGSVQASETCPAPAPAAEAAAPTPGTCNHAINSKGTGATGRAPADHAINTKGTGMAGRAAAPGPDSDCDGSSEDMAARPAPREALLGTRIKPKPAASLAGEPACLAIKEKGTSVK